MEPLDLLAVPEPDRAAVATTHDAVCRDPALAGWVAEVAGRLRQALGRPVVWGQAPGPVFLGTDPRPEVAGGPGLSAYLPVVAFEEVVPDLLADHARRGVPPEVTAATLADVGRMLARNRRWFGEPGLSDELAGWLVRHLTSALVEVGRLQFERVVTEAGDPVLSLHIPETGRFTPEAVDDSLERARRTLHRWYPQDRPAAAHCISWMLDPQLLEILPETSTIADFQRRFTLTAAVQDGDDSMRRFLFGDLATPVEDLPADTSLRRAVLAHWRVGGHWHVRHGSFAWDPGGAAND